MEILPIGTLTICTNFDASNSNLLSEETTDAISRFLIKIIENKIKEKFDEETVILISYKTEVGCVITIIGIGLLIKTIAGAGAATGVYKFIKDYDKIRNNTKLIINDLKNGFLKITHRKKARHEQPSFSVEDIQYYESLPEDLRKYYASGREVVVISEKETITCNKIAVMRDDIVDKIEITETTSRTIKLDQKIFPIKENFK